MIVCACARVCTHNSYTHTHTTVSFIGLAISLSQGDFLLQRKLNFLANSCTLYAFFPSVSGLDTSVWHFYFKALKVLYRP